MAESDALIGQTVSHYRIIEKLGGGGMGVVYTCNALILARFVIRASVNPSAISHCQVLSIFCLLSARIQWNSTTRPLSLPFLA